MTTGPVATALNEAQCWARIRSAQIGRLAVVVGDHPEIFPVNFLVDHGSVVFRTAAGTKLDAAVGGPVAFEVDGYDEDSGLAWSVVVKGTAREIDRLHEVIDAIQLPIDTWHATPKPRLVRVDPVELTGRQFPRAAPTRVTTVRQVAGE